MYICKNCNKEFAEKYSKWSNGDFCCKECARSFSTKNKRTEINKKVSIKMIEKEKYKYYLQPNKCVICNNIIPYRRRKKYNIKTCSSHCKRLLENKSRLEKKHSLGGGYNLNGHRKSIKGYYKGIYCDSTYELAYLIYCLDHNIDIKRCEETFEYEYNGKKHKYHPDFVVNGEIVEIKGYKSELVEIKAKSINKPYKILYWQDLEQYFKYVSQTYNKKYIKSSNNFYELYD